MNIISLFSGCGGLDKGFENSGFNVIWANDNAPSVWETYQTNFPNITLEKKSLAKIDSSAIPNEFIGVIGGPPCQSWSNAGSGRGFKDKRGALFLDYIRVINDKNPLFFVAENVEGLMAKRNIDAFNKIKELLETSGNFGYNLSIETLNSADFEVPQNRKRVFFVGYRNDLNLKFKFPSSIKNHVTVENYIKDLENFAIAAQEGNRSNFNKCSVPNHEYWTGGYSYIFMSRNRVLSWDEPSYTLQASGRQTPIHPSAPKMVKVEKDIMKFVDGKEHLYRRLSIRECARIQTFPDSFKFKYETLNAGYKMIGNSVPVKLAYHISSIIHQDMQNLFFNQSLKNVQAEFQRVVGL